MSQKDYRQKLEIKEGDKIVGYIYQYHDRMWQFFQSGHRIGHNKKATYDDCVRDMLRTTKPTDKK